LPDAPAVGTLAVGFVDPPEPPTPTLPVGELGFGVNGVSPE
jgi:hypothetical protein